jgi:hypothetical protein
MDMYEAEDGQCYCGPHRLEHCHICCCDFRGMNAYARDEITDTADIAEYGEDTFVDAALALHADLFGRPLLESRRAAQARGRIGGAVGFGGEEPCCGSVGAGRAAAAAHWWDGRASS